VPDIGNENIKEFHFDNFISPNDIREFSDVGELTQEDLDKLIKGTSYLILDAS